MDQLKLSLFGTPQLFQRGAPVHIGRNKAMALLAYLAAIDRPISRNYLAAFLCPDLPSAKAYADVRRTLYVLRKVLKDVLESNRDTVYISSDSALQIDVRCFQKRIKSWREHIHSQEYECQDCFTALVEAAEIYADHFLSGFSLSDSLPFDEWQTHQDQKLRIQLAGVLEWLANYLTYQGSISDAIVNAQRLADLDPLHEPGHVLLMRLYAKNGQRSAAIQQYEKCEGLLMKELNVSPQPETVQVYRSIMAGEEINLPQKDLVFSDAAKKKSPNHNLPFQAIPFVGREEIFEDLNGYFENLNCRLLTFAGPGGSGKSRLAIEFAKKNLTKFRDGVYFMQLAACETVADIVLAIAQTIGFKFYTQKDDGISSRSKQTIPIKKQLLGYLHNKSMLLILDNFEHLLDGIELITEILDAAPDVRLLVSSRVKLNVLQEYVYPIPGLDLPNKISHKIAKGSPEELLEYSAVQFFVQCARMTFPQFQLEKENLAHVLRICRAMHGMPLGILLSTAWLSVLTPEKICAEIDQNFDFLETTLFGLPERQRSMRAILNQTWKLLTDQEKDIMLGLSVFQGGFSAQACFYVTNATFSNLRELVNKWLIERDHSGRFNLHEMTKQYLEEKLSSDPSLRREIRNKHLSLYGNFLTKRQSDLEGNQPQLVLEEIHAEIENIRTAWRWALDQENQEAIQRMLIPLAKFFELRVWYQEGENTFFHAFERLSSKESNQEQRETQSLFGQLLFWVGMFSGMQGLKSRASENLIKSLKFLQDAGDLFNYGYALHHIGIWESTVENRKEYAERSLEIFTELNNEKGIAYAKSGLGFVAFALGDFHRAQKLFYESSEIHERLGCQRDIAKSYNNIGYIYWVVGEYKESASYLEKSLALLKKLDDIAGVAALYNLMALNFASLKDFDRCKQFIGKTLAACKEFGDMVGIAVSLTNIGECELMEGHDEEAYDLAVESLPYYKKIDTSLQNAQWYYRIRGEAACSLGKFDEGFLHLQKAFGPDFNKDVINATHTLIGIARYYAANKQIELALERLGLVITHPGSWQWVKDRAQVLVQEYAQKMDSDAVLAALERGKTLRLDSVISDFLENGRQSQS